MSLRKIDETIELPDLSDFQAAKEYADQWQSLNCRLVTPLYGGGVKARESDVAMPIRVAGIRGQLRFWWRLLAQHQFKLPEKDIRAAEFALWGGTSSDDDNGGQASLVFLRVKDVKFKDKTIFQADNATVMYTEYAPRQSSILNYALFPLRDTDTRLFLPDLTWKLEWRFDKRITEQQKKQVIDTLRWWATFGGIGARTRRGCGAFELIDGTQPEILKPISVDEIQAAQCKLAMRDANSAISAWELAVKRLRDFRQGIDVGRNRHGRFPGRSRWSEPDAIRRITKQYAPQHPPEHQAGNQFPRGMFGMPIIFHFTGNGEPQDSTLQPENKNRMSSPVIIRPIKQDGQWKAAALLLPYDFKNLSVELKHGNKTKKVTLWNATTAQHIRPINENGDGGGNPLQAFMSYFEK